MAVIVGERRVTYGELAARAARLASHLRGLGVEPEVTVGVCLERSAEMIVGLLGVLAAGGAYVPLDPAYPKERLAYMLDDSQAALVVTQESCLGALPPLDARRAVLVAPDGEEIGCLGGPCREAHSDPRNLAYLIYTSGSTGRPKGVAIEHRSAVALVRWAAEAFAAAELAGVFAATSICFDLSVFEIFVPLSVGGAVVLAGNALDLPFLPASADVTLVNTVPSAMAELVRARCIPSSVKVVNLAGEVLPGPLVDELYRTTAVERVLNLYGPSEDTTYSTWAQVERDGPPSPPIGRPLPGTRACLLDAGGGAAPPGTEGEIHLGGLGLARGYFGRPDLTAERFVPDSFGGEPGGRLYRTGDLARRLPDGNLHFLGRADQQVKIRGFRIEPGEIEAALLRLPAVREAAVVAREDETLGRRLVAYVAGEEDPSADLRSFLARSLPEHMLPSLFVRLASLPRTLNGKIDRQALPAPPAIGADLVPGPPLAPTDRKGPLPLSFNQQRLWFVERLQAGEPTYNEPAAFDLRGPLDPGALAWALGEVVRRHEILRTRYREVDAEPIQEICEPAPVPLHLMDLGALSPEIREAELERRVREEVRRPFDLSRSPLLRAVLLRRAASEHTLALTVHHIAYDGRSKAILAGELAALYGAALAGRPSPLPPLPLQYGDFAAWQRRRSAADERLAEQVKRLAGAPALELAGDRPRPFLATSRGETVRFVLSPDLAAGVRDLARTVGTTPFRLLLAVFLALLARDGGRNDGVVGATAAGRIRPGLQGLIGFFVNLLPLRCDLSGSPSLRQLLARMQSTVDAAVAGQEVPFDRLVEALRPERSAGRHPLFQILFQLHPPLAVPRLAGVAATARPIDTGTAKFDLEMTLMEDGDLFAGFCQYSRDLYDRTTIDGLVARFQALLKLGLADPDRALTDLPLLPEWERRPLVQAAPPSEKLATAAAPMEELVAALWGQVLGLESVDRDDNFFHLGGHSLLGARLLSRVRDTLGVNLPVQALFRAPTVAGLAAVVAGARDSGQEAAPPIRPCPRRESLLLPSFAQEALWFLDRLAPGSPVYNFAAAFRLSGELHPAALEQSLREIARRHEVLRVRFVEVDGQPFQEVSAPAPELPCIDLGDLPEQRRSMELDRLAGEAAAAPFDLANGPLLRLRLLRLGPEEHALLLTVHHAVFDGGSLAILNRELSALYAVTARGAAAQRLALPPPALQYSDFAAWQRSRLAGETLEAQLAFWRRELAGAPVLLELPTDRPRPPLQTWRGATAPLALPAGCVARLRQVGRRQGVTLFMILLAAFQTLLWRLSGQEDVLVGSPIAGRGRSELEGLIGYFVNTLVLRARFAAAGVPFRDFLSGVRDTALSAYAHQELPFERLVAMLKVERSLAHNPLFQVMLSFQDPPATGLALPGIAVRALRAEAPVAKFDLSLTFEEAGGDLAGALEHNADLFDGATARRFLAALASLLDAAAADPSRRLDELPLLTASELEELRAEGRRTVGGRLPPAHLHDLVAAQAARTPGALALLDGSGRHMTYSELDCAAERMARALRRRGVGPEVVVGVCLERSPELVVALLAVWKAGGVYLPLDPGLPPERLAFLLADSGARLVLRSTGDLAPPHGVAFAVPAELLAEPNAAAGDPAFATSPEALAYVVYTSGSTGKPKGVGVSHAAAAEHMRAAARLFALGGRDRVLFFASPSFDVALEELLPALLSGAALVLRGKEIWGPATLLGRVAELGITVLDLPTAYWHEWVAEIERAAPTPATPLRLVVLGGEAMSAAAARRWRRTPLAGIRLLNGYGPTEAVVTATAFEVGGAPAEAGVPIGRPLGGRAAWVLDVQGRPLPAGVPGELCLGGRLLARGYLGRPGLTAERFVPDPFADEAGARLYRTGDRARRRADGILEFLGRLDRQVKVRGFRIEPGEIEAVLRRHPAIREAVVDVVEVAGDRRLVAWLTAEEAIPDDGELRELLRRELPDYMLPAAFVPLAALPLTPYGKVDRRSLPSPAPPTPESAAPSPRSPTEELLSGLWLQVLGRAPAGADENFFAAGGHSLLAIRLLSRARDTFGLEIPIAALFAAPTLGGLAAAIDAAGRQPAAGVAVPPLPAIRRQPGERRAPLSFAQQRLWFLDRLQPDRAVYSLPTALVLRGGLDAAALEWSLGEVVRRHGTLRTRFVEVDGQPWQEVLDAADGSAAAFSLPRIDLGALPPERRPAERDRLGREEARRPFDLAGGPLLRAALIRVAQREHALLLNLHHIVADAWSEDVLHREVSALYPAAQAARPSPLPELPVQYADFARWQRGWPDGILEAQLAYWRRQLAGLTTLELPADRPRSPVQTFRGGTVALALPPPLAAALRDLARRQGATLFMTLLGAWQTLLNRRGGQVDLAVGSPLANRDRTEIEGLIGIFVNLLALRCNLAGDPPFDELLIRVRRVALDAYGHQDLPFERLVDELSPERDMSRQPLVQVMFALQSSPPAPLALPGIAAAPLELGETVAKFDLTLYLAPSPAESGGLTGGIEYSADLFDRTAVQRLAGQLVNVLAEVAARPGSKLSEIGLLSPSERHQVVQEWNDTEAPFPADSLLHQLFEAAADRNPEALAAACDEDELTYAELEARANRMAALLRQRGVRRGNAVGVWMERSLDLLAAVLGVLKCGGHYLPLDPAWPVERAEAILAAAGAPAILTRSAHLGRVLEMQWRLPPLTDIVCLDEKAEAPPPEPLDAEGVRALFDLVAERAVDRATAGGFVSRLTGEPFSAAEIDEYRDRVLSVASPYLGPDRRVLEIGCGSGLLLWEMAPRVARCVGLDPSPRTQERNRARAERDGLRLELPVGFADAISSWPDDEFDLVLLASTAQFFPGPLYLARVVRHALRLLASGGALLIADVPDARRRDRRDPRPLLHLDEDFFRDLAASLPMAGEAAVLHRESGFANELRFRFDVLITRRSAEDTAERPCRKHLWTSWHVERHASERPPAVASGDDLAYVIHTSGSTGEPKGIAVQHRAVANLIGWVNDALGVRPEDRILFVTSPCFDLSVYDMFGILAAGGTVQVASETALADPQRLVRELLAGSVTLWDSAPAALVRLAPLFPAQPAAASRLRRVLLSGDWIPTSLPDRVRAAFPRARVVSLGGATEATIWSNWYPIGEVSPRWPSIPYGRPIANARYHVLDDGFAPCPIGVPGDLYIGGDCLCVGYARQPSLTAAAFLPDPFTGPRRTPGARIYRTGDRARAFADGNLEFLGRVDGQVKIRGFRIELGEIEAALSRHPAVREAVALAREDLPGDRRLVAYLVPAAESTPAAGDLRDFLRRSLPEYMIPVAFVTLEVFPVTPNGKLDRAALPAPDRGPAATDDAPGTATEIALAALWREILRVDGVGIRDSFFTLGGHSLLATQLLARLRQTFGAEVPLRAIFQAPTLHELAAALDVQMAKLEVAAGGATIPVRRRPRGGEPALSASQLRQWFLVQLEPDSTGYNLPLTLDLAGALSPAALAAALGEIIRRHEALRTTFAAATGRPIAAVTPTAPFALAVVDLGSLAETVQRAESRRLVRFEVSRPFDLARGPLMRAQLIRLDPDDHLLAATVHHIAFDGWSLGVFLRELAALHEALAAGRPSPLPDLPLQYADYAAWQQEWLASQDAIAQAAYWRQRLAGATSVLHLPTDRPRPAVQTNRGAVLPLTFTSGLAAGLKTLAGREVATLFMVLLAGFAALLSRYTGQDDVNVGTFVANRRHEALERLIGLFVNTLVLRADLRGAPSFHQLLSRARETALAAFDHQEVPFERVLEELPTERDLSRTPLFQALLGVQNFALPAVAASGLALRPVDLAEYGRATCDLALWMWEEGDDVRGWLEFNVDLFDRATAERMGRHLTVLLAAAAAAPGRRASELPLLTAEERQQLVEEWSAGLRHAAAPALVHERLHAQARRTPEAPAVVAGARTLTYRELDRRAARVARGLARRGVGREAVVALAIDRSPEMIVGLYGILGAGAAYLPLDPALPSERLALLLRDAGARLVLTRRDLVGPLRALPARVLVVDGDFESDSNEGLREIGPAPANAAYLLYTSGSTGTPKGVVVEHRALAAFAAAAIETYGLRSSDRVLQFASLSFDASAEEIFPCLSAGGTLVLRDEAMLASPARFWEACRRSAITVLDLPTAYWHELGRDLPAAAAGLPAGLRLIILGGERVLAERARSWLQEVGAGGGRPRLLNTYGPTEATVVATVYEIAGTASPLSAVPIGRPLRGVEVYVLDGGLEPLPVGIHGEICLGGDGLARGYRGRPGATAERFVPSPLAQNAPGARLYRTGDLGSFRPDGQLDFAGRADDQVKIRGFRIEPAEVAAALARHPAVLDAAAVAHEVRPGERELTAYAVPAGLPWPEPAELRAFLKESLPAYMAPADIVLLAELPRTKTGKLDRRALPAPDRAARASRGNVAPETPTEELLAEIWQQLLNVDRVGVYDNFFDLGGHSLLAPQVFSRIEDTFQIELPLRLLFEAPTIAQLATALEHALFAEIDELSEEEAAGLAATEIEGA